MTGKIPWKGEVLSVQPRIRLSRSFDQSSHSYLGYVLRIDGTLGDEVREFVVALGKGAHEKHQFRVGDRVHGSGQAVSVRARSLDPATTPKSLAPSGYSVKNVVLADPLGAQLLAGHVPDWWEPRPRAQAIPYEKLSRPRLVGAA